MAARERTGYAVGGGVTTVAGVFAGIVAETAPKGTDVANDGWFLFCLSLALFGAVIVLSTALTHSYGWWKQRVIRGAITAPAHIEDLEADSRVAAPPTSWLAPAALGSYLDEINRIMEEKGFGQNPLLESQQARSLSWAELNTVRNGKYRANRGLFLVHSWMPSTQLDQVADVQITLAQHGDGPLTDGTITGVQYTLGPKFTEHSRVITSPKNHFAIEVSMYGSMLCLAEVCFGDGSPPLILERYIDFDGSRA